MKNPDIENKQQKTHYEQIIRGRDLAIKLIESLKGQDYSVMEVCFAVAAMRESFKHSETFSYTIAEKTIETLNQLNNGATNEK